MNHTALNRSTYYYKKQGLKEEDYKIMKRVDEIFTKHPYYGVRRMAKVLKERKKISKYYGLMALEAIYPKINISKKSQAHKVYPYLLSGLEINRPNQVWSG